MKTHQGSGSGRVLFIFPNPPLCCGVLVALLALPLVLYAQVEVKNELSWPELNWNAWIDFYTDTWPVMLSSFLKHHEHLVSVVVTAATHQLIYEALVEKRSSRWSWLKPCVDAAALVPSGSILQCWWQNQSQTDSRVEVKLLLQYLSIFVF